MYGDCDSLVDIDVMLTQLPSHTVAKRLRGYEHLDILWGKDVDRDVIPHILETLGHYCGGTRNSEIHPISVNPSEYGLKVSNGHCGKADPAFATCSKQL